jgi:hypothetical protein
VTSPDKPDTADTTTRAAREERTVATAAPAVESEPTNGTKPSGTPGRPASATESTQAKPAAPAKPAAQAKPVVKPAAPAPARPAVAPAAKAQPEKPAAAATDGADVTSSAPPPWQRVATDAQYVERDLPGDGSTSASEATTRFSDWGYQRSPRSDSYSERGAASADALNAGGVSGTAANSVFAATAGQSGVRADARPTTDPTGRTTVNFAPPPASSVRPPTAPATSALRRPGRGPRRASLQVRRVDPWSVLKLAFVLSVALFFVWLVAVGVLYGVLDGMGVWDRVNGTYNEFAQNTSSGSSGPLITASRVFGIAAIIGAINIVLFTALATVGSFVYNVSADLAGGLEITLAERE